MGMLFTIIFCYPHDRLLLEVFSVEAVPSAQDLLSCSCKKVGKEHARGVPPLDTPQKQDVVQRPKRRRRKSTGQEQTPAELR